MSAHSILNSWNVDRSWTLFLDRDGVINEKVVGDYVRNWPQFRWKSNAAESIGKLTNYFGHLFVVTNQQGIDKGLFSHEDLEDIHNRMLEIIEYFDGRLDGIYYEPSLAQYDAFRRKPNPGMAFDARSDYSDVDFRKSIIIGDSLNDLKMGNNLGMKTVWVESLQDSSDIAEIVKIYDIKVSGLAEFCQLITDEK